MALERLKEEIFRKTAPLKNPSGTLVCRTWYVLLSPAVHHLRDWYQESFPILDEELRELNQWILVAEGAGADEVYQQVNDSMIRSFNAETVNRLTANGYRIIDGTNQVLLVGDLTEDGPHYKLEQVCEGFAKAFSIFTGIQASNVFSGLFLLRTLKRQEGKERFIVSKTDSFEAVNTAMINRLNKAVLIDIANPYMVISNPADLHSLQGQILYCLTRKPTDFAMHDNVGGFTEWVNRNALSEGKISGFSGVSLVVPIDYVVETLLVAKAGEVIRTAFLAPPSSESIARQQNNLLAVTHLKDSTVLKGMLFNNDRYPLNNPFASLTAEGDGAPSCWDPSQPKMFVDFCDLLDTSLPAVAAENRAAMEILGMKLVDEFRYTLQEQVNGILVHERSGIPSTIAFLEALKKHLAIISSESTPTPVYADVTGLVKDLGRKSEAAPRRSALAARVALVTAASLTGYVWNGMQFDAAGVTFLMLALLAPCAGLFYWKGTQSILVRLVLDIWQRLRDKWQKLMDNAAAEVAAQLLPEYSRIVDELLTQVMAAQVRITEVLDYVSSEYVPEPPETNAFWIHALKGRSEVKKYESLLTVDLPKAADEYIAFEKPLAFWERFALPGAGSPNEWEWSLVEKASLRLFPHSEELFRLSVCRILRDFPAKRENFTEVLRRSATPFLRIKHGTYRDMARGVIEIHPDDCNDIKEQLKRDLTGDIPTIDWGDSSSPYRVSLFSFVDGVLFVNLVVEG